MAKKVVATLKKAGGVTYAKAIKMVKTEKGGYAFDEKVMVKEEVANFFKA